MLDFTAGAKGEAVTAPIVLCVVIGPIVIPHVLEGILFRRSKSSFANRRGSEMGETPSQETT